MHPSSLSIRFVQEPGRSHPKVLHPFCGNGLITKGLLSLAPLVYVGIEPQKMLYKQAFWNLNHVMHKTPFAVEVDPQPAVQCLLLTPGPYQHVELLEYLHPWLQPGGLCLFFVKPHDATQDFSRWCMTHLIDPCVFPVHYPSLQHTRGIIGQVSGTPLDPSGRIHTFLKECKHTGPQATPTLGAYTIPLPIHEQLHIYPKLTNDDELLASLQQSALWTHPTFQQEVNPPPPTVVRPLMPVKPCHLALQIAAGVLNGQEVRYDDKPLLIKGRTIKKEHSWKEEELSPEGLSIDVTKSTENYSTIVHALDLDKGTLYAITH